MASIERFKTNREKETDGTWVDIGEGASLKLARIGNPRYEAFLMEQSKPLRTAMRAGNFNDPRLKSVMIKAIARYVLLDWDGLDEDDKPVPYSEQKAIEWMTEIPDFYRMILDLGQDSTLFKDEDGEGNSGKSSIGNSDSELTQND